MPTTCWPWRNRDEQHRDRTERRHELEDAGEHAERDGRRHAEEEESRDARDADDHGGRGLGAHVSRERAVHVAQVFLAAPLQVSARQHAQRRALERGGRGEEQERDDRRDREPAGIPRRGDDLFERAAGAAFERRGDARGATEQRRAEPVRHGRVGEQPVPGGSPPPAKSRSTAPRSGDRDPVLHRRLRHPPEKRAGHEEDEVDEDDRRRVRDRAAPAPNADAPSDRRQRGRQDVGKKDGEEQEDACSFDHVQHGAITCTSSGSISRSRT